MGAWAVGLTGIASLVGVWTSIGGVSDTCGWGEGDKTFEVAQRNRRRFVSRR